MRSYKGPARKAVASAGLAQKAYIIVLDFDGGPLGKGGLKGALEAEHGVREMPLDADLGSALDQLRKPRHRFDPRRSDGDGGLGHLLLEPGEMRRRPLAHLEQAIALPH